MRDQQEGDEVVTEQDRFDRTEMLRGRLRGREDASAWRARHLDGFMREIRACDDVQTLRALAHRLGYKEGM